MLTDDGLRPVSNSELQTFKRCKRQWWLAYYRQLKLKSPEVVGPAPLGTRVHKALERYYSPEIAMPVAEVLALWAKETEELLEAHPEHAAEVHKDSELGRLMLEGYFEWLEETGADADLEVVATERVVEVPFVEGTKLVGKLDMRARRLSDGAQFFVDHKTVPNLTDLPKWAQLNEQILMYCLLEMLAADEETRSDGGIFNMLRKVKRTAKANPPFYGREEVRHNLEALRSFYTRTAGTVHELMRVLTALDAGESHLYVAPPTPRSTCSWDCDFFAVCPLFDDGSDAEGLLEAYYEHGDPNARYGEKEGA